MFQSSLARKAYFPNLLRQLLLWSCALVACFYILTYSRVLNRTARHSTVRKGGPKAFGYTGKSGTLVETSEDIEVRVVEKAALTVAEDLPAVDNHSIVKSEDEYTSQDESVQEKGIFMSGETRRNAVEKRPARFILYRLVGNDMPPIQRPGQLLWNTEYILENESNFPDCRKKWILNRILNQTSRAELLRSLGRHGYGRHDIIDIKADISELAESGAEDWESSVVAQNAARNYALEDGYILGSSWLLIFDGNIFVTDEGWRAVVNSADRAERLGLKYFKVPMYRLFKMQDPSWLTKSTQFASVADYLPVKGESQIAIHRDAEAKFDEKRGYGKGNKLVFIYNTCGRIVSASSPCLCGEVYAEDFEEGVNKTQSFNLDVVARCGYTVRLWPHFEEGVNETRALGDSVYRGQLRVEAKTRLWNMLQEAIRSRGLPIGQRAL